MYIYIYIYLCMYKDASNCVMKTVARVVNTNVEPTISTHTTNRTTTSSE